MKLIRTIVQLPFTLSQHQMLEFWNKIENERTSTQDIKSVSLSKDAEHHCIYIFLLSTYTFEMIGKWMNLEWNFNVIHSISVNMSPRSMSPFTAGFCHDQAATLGAGNSCLENILALLLIWSCNFSYLSPQESGC